MRKVARGIGRSSRANKGCTRIEPDAFGELYEQSCGLHRARDRVLQKPTQYVASEIKDIMPVPVFTIRAMRISISPREQQGIARPPGVAKRFFSSELLGGLARTPNQVHSITEEAARFELTGYHGYKWRAGNSSWLTNLRTPRNKAKTTGALRNMGHGLRIVDHTVSRTGL